MLETPAHLEAQLKALRQDARALADTKGLAAAFEMELFSFERAVEEALAARSAEAARLAVAQGRKLLTTLKDAPDKSGGLLVR